MESYWFFHFSNMTHIDNCITLRTMLLQAAANLRLVLAAPLDNIQVLLGSYKTQLSTISEAIIWQTAYMLTVDSASALHVVFREFSCSGKKRKTHFLLAAARIGNCWSFICSLSIWAMYWWLFAVLNQIKHQNYGELLHVSWQCLTELLHPPHSYKGL